MATTTERYEKWKRKQKADPDVGFVSVLREQMHLPDILTVFACGSMVGSQASAIAALDLLTCDKDNQNAWVPTPALSALDCVSPDHTEHKQWPPRRQMYTAVQMQTYAPLIFGVFETILYAVDKIVQDTTNGERERPSRWRYVVYTALGIALGVACVWLMPHRRNGVSVYLVLSTALFFGYFLSNVNWYMCRRKRSA
jgi:hypothetical protein